MSVDKPTPATDRTGVLAWFATNHVAANLVYLLLLAIGAISVLFTKLEVFPEIEPNVVTVAVPYPGANPEEVEQGVILKLEEAVADVEGVKKTRGIAVENQGVVTVEAQDSANMDDFYDDVRQAIDRVTTLPAGTEKPSVSRAGDKIQVVTLALYGDVDKRALREQAERVKDDLQQSGAVSQVSIGGLPPYEISVELDERTLRQYGLTFADVAAAIRSSSLDLPAGDVEGKQAQVLVRSTNQKYRGEDFEKVVVTRADNGTAITVGDLGRVVDGFEDTDYDVSFDGKPAALLEVYRIGSEGALNIASTVNEYVATQRDRLPAGMTLTSYNDNSEILKSRITLMLKNAGLGLVLVVVTLGLFLDLRLAFWAAGGLVLSVVASLALLPAFDVSINMMSLFAFILVLGILVDDAIVVGENIQSHREMGKSYADASIDGVREVAIPVLVTILTTAVAFAPLLFASGVIGKILKVIPIVVISVLVLSLIEALFVLPAHLAGGGGWEPKWYTALRKAAGRGLDWFAGVPYRTAVFAAVRWRYVTLAAALGLCMIVGGWVYAGFLPWRFFPEVEGDVVAVTVEMPPGTSAARTAVATKQLYDAATKLEGEFAPERPKDAPPLVRHIQVANGGLPFGDIANGPGGNPAVASRDPRLGEILLELRPGEDRDISAARVVDKWRELLGDVPGARSVKFKSDLLSAGDDVNVELRSRDTAKLALAADWLKGELRQIEGVREVKDNFQNGKPEIQITGLTPLGDALGLDPTTVFRQVRGAFYGEEAQRVQRGRDEVKVFVRYPPEQRRSLADVENFFVRLPDGTESPLSRVATYRVGEGFSAINRTNRRRVVAVTASVDDAATTNGDVNGLLTASVLPQLVQKFPDVSFSMEGEAREQAESLQSLLLAMVVAVIGIYGMLAMQFKSYVQPLVVMSAIPFGIVGAVLGHVLLNEFFRPTPLSFLSMFGVVALTGVVVNDSLILIDLINRRRLEEGVGATSYAELLTLACEAGIRRFRPIFLTTITTFFGLVPIIVETSLQAQFIIPMAVSLAFGVLFATAITLILVPALYMIVEDARRFTLPFFGAAVRYDTPDADIAARPAAA